MVLPDGFSVLPDGFFGITRRLLLHRLVVPKKLSGSTFYPSTTEEGETQKKHKRRKSKSKRS